MYSFLLLYYTYVFIKFCDASGEAHYECGPHGRFEYCIDGIPGCVVGCHCHPGYYFDTETKICEPNIKLAQDYRRHFYLEPTRMPLANTLEPVSPPTLSTKNPVDEKVDAIAQDADDLGDWLYNQFFKTIENQVINKTDSEALTRRSGSSPIQPARPIPKKRSRKRQKKSSRRKKSGKKRFNKKGLKRKLLRITEDDSLFDSTSDETDDDSSADLTSSESFSDSSFETDDQFDDKGHGHRKILMINKKPAPSLPSFIFLPNVQTPFYPPIGLPPPPVMPMYPMVPVPPVGPFLVIKEKNETEEPSDKCSTTVTPTTKERTESTETTTVAALTTTTNSTKLRASDNFDENSKALWQNNERQNKMMRLRNKMKKKNKKLSTQPLDFPDAESPYLNDGESPMPMKFRSHPMYDSIPPLDDVDFKYLSQLIHKVDLNKTKPNILLKPNHGMEGVPPNLDPVIISRRNYQAQIHSSATPESDLQYHRSGRPASKADDMSEAFYSNLGKQIAALIRKKVDGDGPSQFDINIEQQSQKSPMHAIFNENRFAPRSYWERFVRSPLRHPQTYEDNNMINTKQSSENLLNLENQVNVATAIERIFSLQELENIANTMVTRQGQGSKKNSRILKLTRNPSPILSKTFGISLLPPDVRRRGSTIRAVKNNNPEYNNKNILKKKNERNVLPNNFYVQPRKQAIYRNQNITKQNPVIIAKNVTHSFLSKLFKSPRKSPLHNQVSRIVQRNITAPKLNPAQRIVKYQLNPVMVNYKSIKYVGNNRKQYHSQQSIPFPLFSQHSVIKPTRVNPHHSYFRHEYHHFDYFD